MLEGKLHIPELMLYVRGKAPFLNQVYQKIGWRESSIFKCSYVGLPSEFSRASCKVLKVCKVYAGGKPQHVQCLQFVCRGGKIFSVFARENSRGFKVVELFMRQGKLQFV